MLGIDQAKQRCHDRRTNNNFKWQNVVSVPKLLQIAKAIGSVMEDEVIAKAIDIAAGRTWYTKAIDIVAN